MVVTSTDALFRQLLAPQLGHVPHFLCDGGSSACPVRSPSRDTLRAQQIAKAVKLHELPSGAPPSTLVCVRLKLVTAGATSLRPFTDIIFKTITG